MIQAHATGRPASDLQPPTVVAVCVSPGGIPKQSLDEVRATPVGLEGDGHAHAKHNRPDRAISLFDMETLVQLRREGFPLYPGAIGENLTVSGLKVQQLPRGTLLQIGQVVLRLEEPRKPCYVLDAIDPCLKDVIVGRCGYMASVVRGGALAPGMRIAQVSSADSLGQPARVEACGSQPPEHSGST